MTERLEKVRDALALGRYHEARVCYENVMNQGGLSLSTELDAHHYGVTILLRLQRFSQAVAVAEKACTLAENAEPEHQARAWYDRGVVAQYLSDWPVSIECFTKYCDLAQMHPAVSHHVGQALFNIGIAHRARHDYALALDYYRRAATEFAQRGSIDPLIRTAQNSAWLLANLDRLPEAEGFTRGAEEALRVAEDEASDCLRFQQVLIRARFAIKSGDTVAARRHLVEASDTHPGATAETVAQARLVRAELAMTEGLWGEALAAAKEALLLAERAQDSIVLAEANRLRREVFARSEAANEVAVTDEDGEEPDALSEVH